MKNELVIVFVTVPSAEVGEALGRAIVEERLAACVNILPQVRSIFHWEGKVDTADELLLLFKSRSEVFAKLRDRIIELHPYDTPEVVGVGIDKIAEKYAAWVVTETSAPTSK